MKRVRNIAIGFLLFNSMSFAAFAACASSIVINGATCRFNAEFNDFCWYECPNGDVVARPKGNGDFIPIDDGGF